MPGPSKRWLFWIVIFGVIGFIGTRQYNADEYPDAWPKPALIPGSFMGCPNFSGEYDNANDSIPRLLTHQPIWEKGMRGWFEHKAIVTQAPDDSWIKISFELNERGLVEHREHVMKYGRGWPSGHFHPVTLKKGDHYDCGMRWFELDVLPDVDLTETGNGKVRMSLDRHGNLIAAYVKKEWTSFGIFFGQSIGPSWQHDKTRWVRWTKRPKGADEALKALQTLEVVRQKHFRAYGAKRLIGIGNFMGRDMCVRVWDNAAPNPDAPEASIRNSEGIIGERKRLPDGSLVLDLPCPEGWEWFKPTQLTNYFLRTIEPMTAQYKMAWFPLKEPGAKPTERDLDDLDALPDPPRE